MCAASLHSKDLGVHYMRDEMAVLVMMIICTHVASNLISTCIDFRSLTGYISTPRSLSTFLPSFLPYSMGLSGTKSLAFVRHVLVDVSLKFNSEEEHEYRGVLLV